MNAYDYFAEPYRRGWRIVDGDRVEAMPGIVFVWKRDAVAAIWAMLPVSQGRSAR